MIREQLANLSFKDRAVLKAKEIAKLKCDGEFVAKGIRVEISEVQEIEKGGVKMLVRAWKGKKQYGFMDGSVEFETIRVFNPPLLVDDPNGDIVQKIDISLPGSIQKEYIDRKLREDPVEALKQTIVSTIIKIGTLGSKIQKGKIGTTTSVFFSGSGDGYSAQWEVSASWDTVHDATSGNDTSAGGTNFYMGFTAQGAGKYTIARMFLPFDTSSLPDTDDVSAAVLSVFSTGTLFNTDNDGDNFIAIVGPTTQASPTTLVNADYDTCGSVNSPSEGAPRLSLNSWSNGSGNQNDFTLNATGISWISKTGYTLIGAREGHDVVDSAIANGANNGASIYLSEQSGTSNDPTLTVTHAPASSIKTIDGLAKASVKTVNGLAIASVKTIDGLA